MRHSSAISSGFSVRPLIHPWDMFFLFIKLLFFIHSSKQSPCINLSVMIMSDNPKPSDAPTQPSNPTPTFHPVLGLTNIKTHITFVLDMENVQYSNWVELFENYALVYNVLDHINTSIPRPSDINESMWKRLDGVVKQWIYCTISIDLLQTFS